MVAWVLQMALFSLLLIWLIHHLVRFFKDTLTVPKIKDLVNAPSHQYQQIYHILQDHPSPTASSSSPSQDYTLIDLLPEEPPTTMKNELKHFLKSQLQ